MKKLALGFAMLILLSNFAIAYSAPNTTADLTKIEKYIYGYDYNGETETQRIERLEQYAYGFTSKGAANQRITKLMKDLNVVEEKVATAPKNTNAKNTNTTESYDYDDDTPKADATAQYPVVDALEKKIFNKVNEKEDIYNRVSKLEKQIFKKESNQPLNERVDKLRTAVITDVGVAGYDDDGYTTITPGYSQTNPNMVPFETAGGNSNYYSPEVLNSNSLYNEISMLEREVLNQTYPTMGVGERLSQLESKVLQRVYSNDDEATRVERIAAASEAQKSPRHYGGSKFERHLATGIQIAGFLLMILAFVL